VLIESAGRVDCTSLSKFVHFGTFPELAELTHGTVSRIRTESTNFWVESFTNSLFTDSIVVTLSG